MEEELNENDLEERLYAMIHHVDGTQADENTDPRQDASPRVGEPPRSTVKRYWRTSHNSVYQKINTPKDAPSNKNTPANVSKNIPAIVNKNTPVIVNKNTPAPVNTSHAAATKNTDPKPKAEKNNASKSPPSAALAILQNTQPHNYVKTVQILEIDEPNVVELESSDEDEVIEVALPPKPTITIESSDEEELVVRNDKKPKDKKNNTKENKSPNKNNRDISASPVPSVVSCMSDDFIRGDCLALNISSAQPDNETFDFSLHGSDLLEEGTPSKKRKKKKSKDRLTSTPIIAESVKELTNADNIFATPKSKAKNKKTKTKSYTVSEKIIPNADVYDSDSNQSVLDVTKNPDAYIVTETRFPSADVYESDSSVAESIRAIGKQPALPSKANEIDSSDSNTSMELSENTTLSINVDKNLVVDLTKDLTVLDQTRIEENIVIGNISGYSDVNEYGGNSLNSTSDPKEIGEFCSTKVPQILYEDLDFDNLKGKDKVCRRRRYSLTTLRAEMDKFYNESWGGENFNHQEILKNMSRDKSLWVIDPKDRMPNPPKRRVTCNYCNRIGHRDDNCERKPPVCHMCGNPGHYEPRCPTKICVNCGSPNFMYSTMCRNCAPWRQLTCAECGRAGHPASHCPDTWRRYHNTIDENMALESCGEKPYHQQQCSGCAKRGHPVHVCRVFLPLCSLPVPSPRVQRYTRLYPPTQPANPGKRRSKSPTRHETHVNKKRMSESDADKLRKNPEDPNTKSGEAERAPDFIPIGNRDKKGQVIQDNEVSDTSEVKTSARIYLSDDMMKKLHSPAGRDWIKRSVERFSVDVLDDSGSFLTVVGTIGSQEAFQAELRSWNDDGNNDTQNDDSNACAMPKKKNDLLRKLNTAFDSLKTDIGDPKKIYKELTYLQNRHDTIKNLKVISPKQLNNNRSNINSMLRKLNMVLLGQAGLAGGADHLRTLHFLKDRLSSIRNQKIPNALRAEISQHYRTIFTPLARDDYKDLMQKFYSTMRPNPLSKNSPVTPKNKKKKKRSKSKGMLQLLTENVKTPNEYAQPGKQVPMPTLIKNLIKKLSCFHSSLLKWKGNAKFNKQRVDIARKVYNEIISLTESEGQPQHEQMLNLKKAQKIQYVVKGFLKRSQKRDGNATQRPGARVGEGQQAASAATPAFPVRRSCVGPLLSCM